MIKMKSRPLRIGYFADGPWSHRTFELLTADADVDVCFVVPRNDTADQFLAEHAERHKIDYLHPIRVNSRSFIETVKGYECDLLVSMSYNQIFRKDILAIPELGVINCHAGKLPFYRGRNILNWALINDEKEFGITVHYVDEGIDTGDIILQECYPITDKDDYSSLLEKAYEKCPTILYKAITMIKNGEAERQEQDEIHPVGFYCGRRGPGDECIHWNQDSRSIFNFIRAICIPGPSAQTTVNGVVVSINASRLIEGAPEYKNTPGQILKRTEEGYLVKTRDSFIEITEVRTEADLKVGDRLGS
jgi:methionyl-tRNA formyltransferase